MLHHRFKLIYVENGNDHPCIATIDVIRFEAPSIYASWSVQTVEGAAVAAKSRSYLVGENLPEDSKLIRIIKDDLRKYRIGRSRAFKDLE
jgi:hypothetical protein